MKLAASCLKHLTVLLAIGVALTASSRLSFATPQPGDSADGTRVLLLIVDRCETSGYLRGSIVGIDLIPAPMDDVERAFEALTGPPGLLNDEGFDPCETVLLLVPLPEPDRNPIVSLDAAVWSRSGPRIAAATSLP